MTALHITAESTPLRRRLGPVAWFVLEELVPSADDAAVVETSVRALAGDLSLNNDTVARALGRLRAEGLVVAEPQPNDGGRFGAGRYRPTDIAGLQCLRGERAERQGTSRRHRTTHSALPGQLRLLDDELPDQCGSSMPGPPPQNACSMAPEEPSRPSTSAVAG